MSRNSKHVLPGAKIEVASGAATPGPKPDQLPPSEQSGGGGSTPAGSKPRENKRRARRNDRYAPRPDHGGARHLKHKRPNAQKYGVFATSVIIPGEDPSEYQARLVELLNWWNPLGPDLRHAVHCLAESRWRLRRLKKAVQTELYTDTFDPKHPAFQETWGFAMFHSCLRSEPETCFEKYAKKYLRPATISHLEQKFPRSNYPSASEWARAVETEIISMSYEPPGSDGQADPLKEAAREWKTDQQVKGSIVYSRELLEYEDKETERLEARIRKQTNYCAELKAMEEMRSRT